jgi:MFS family permease
MPAAGAIYPRGRLIVVFLAVFAIWHLATGSFNPFFNAYFSIGRHVGTETIGTIFSVAQLMQIFALMIAPIMLRRLGLPNGVAVMMAATGIGFSCLAIAHSTFAAATAYAGYVAFQWMSEPGINALLMSKVKPEERSGLSALYYLVAFSAQAVAAAAAGAWIARAGFEPLLFTVSAIALTAALALRKLGTAPETASTRSLQEPQSIPESAA